MCDATRKCARCSKEIEINRDNITGVALLENKYYHTDCLVDYAAKRIKAKKHAAYWDFAHEHIDICEKNAQEAIMKRFYKDDLNDHLLNHYDVTAIPSRFWDALGDIGNGKYKGRKCKPVDIKTILRAWQWAQKRLDDIAVRNKTQHKGPENDSQRLIYDFAVVVNHLEDYKRYMARTKVEDSVVQQQKQNPVKINYNSLERNTQANNGLGDISDLLDEIF